MLRGKMKYAFFVLTFIIVLTGSMAIAPFGYSEQAMTPLSALQTGIEKINGLIASKKLDPQWADSFSKVTVSMRNVKGFTEYALQFSSDSGSPAVVTLFYNTNGTYSGSSLND